MASPPAPLEDTLRCLFDCAARSTLHRLAGTRNLVDGWALLGAPPERKAAVEERCHEDRVMIGRLSWLMESGFLAPPGIEDLLVGERSIVLLHAVLGLGVPEEARTVAFPRLDSRLALAAATWVAITGGSEPRWSVGENGLALRSSEPGQELPGWWLDLFGALDGIRVGESRLEVEVQPQTAPSGP